MKKYMFFLLLTSFYVQAMEKEKNNHEDHGFIDLQEVYFKKYLPLPHGSRYGYYEYKGIIRPIFAKKQVKKPIEVQNDLKKNNGILLP